MPAPRLPTSGLPAPRCRVGTPGKAARADRAASGPAASRPSPHAGTETLARGTMRANGRRSSAGRQGAGCSGRSRRRCPASIGRPHALTRTGGRARNRAGRRQWRGDGVVTDERVGQRSGVALRPPQPWLPHGMAAAKSSAGSAGAGAFPGPAADGDRYGRHGVGPAGLGGPLFRPWAGCALLGPGRDVRWHGDVGSAAAGGVGGRG